MDLNNLNDSFFSCSSSSLSDYDSALSEDSVVDCPNLRNLIKRKLSANGKHLNIIHINAQSVPAHFADLLLSFDHEVVDAILISESFLKPSLPSSLYTLPGFILIRNDRLGKGCGGVAIYLRADIPFKIIDQSPGQYSNFAEHLFIEIIVNHTKVLLGVYYPPSSNVNYFSSLETKLELYTSLYDHNILLGDFNTCLLKKDARTTKLETLISSVNMHILPLSATHHAPNFNPSLLDLILVSNIDRVATHGQLTAPFSHHDLLFLSYKIRSPKRKPTILTLRSYKNINLESLKSDACNIDWSSVINANSIDDKVASFVKIVTDLYDIHAPLKRVKIKHPPAPWLTQPIKKLMAKRDRAKRIYKKFPTDENLTSYKKLRNRCSRMCRDAKKRHIHDSIQNSSPSQMWKFLNSLGLGKGTSDSPVSFDLNVINSHFSKSPLSLDNKVKSATICKLSRQPLPNCPPFSFCEVAEDDILKILSTISTKAVGTDSISIQMLQILSFELAPAISHIINYSFETSSFPSSFKSAYVIPLPKTSNPISVSDFRPISILPVLSKVIEGSVQKQLSLFLTQNSLLSPFQSGFRPGHSTVSALTKVSDDIRWAMDKGLVTILVLLDFSSAFNSVDYDILLSILSSFNVSPSAISWFKSYLFGRSQSVRSGESTSDWCSISAGVPQGGVLSPLLFSIFINSITQIISCHYHLYADDLQIYCHIRADEIAEGVSKINSELHKINVWAKAFGLLVNPSKSQAVIFGSQYMLNVVAEASPPSVLYAEVPIAYSNKAKNLGVIFDSHLSWVSHINEISRRVNFSFHSLKRLQWFLPFETKVTLAQALLLPLIDYGDVCFLDATEVLVDKLERLQNLCIRFIFGLRKFDHVSEFRSRLNWLPIRRRRDLHVLSFLFVILHNPLSPPYLRERFNYLVPRDQPCRSIMSSLLITPSHNSSCYGDSFTVHAVKLWNSLPHAIRSCQTLTSFKSKLKEHYLSL